MAPPSDTAKPSDLPTRLISAAVLGPVVLAAAWIGGPFLSVLTVAAAGLMGWEWARLIEGGRLERSGQLMIAGEVAGVGAAAIGAYPLALVLLAIASLGAVLLARAGRKATAPWAGLGVLWIGFPCVGLIFLAADPVTGRATILWLLAVVWATDTAAYFVGRGLGGPRIAPRWSPKKTWSGALGGLVAAAIIGLVTAQILGISGFSAILWVSPVVSIASQLGDLGESLLKRRFGVKDASGLIPGHGGFLDRLDGMLAAVATVAALVLVKGASPVAWG